MRYSIFPAKDTSIYESSSNMNTGMDAILELTKTIVGGSNYNSRILMKYDISGLTAMISESNISDPKFFLHMWSDEVKEIPAEYDIHIHPIIESWSSGVGRSDNQPITVDGASWVYRNAIDPADTWISTATGSIIYQTNQTGSWSTVKGGAAWWITPMVTQSYSYESADLNVDVTSIVNQWTGSIITNNGFIIKHSDSDEASSTNLGSLNFYSTDTNTVWLPHLEMMWDDSVFVTGSLSQLTGDDLVIYTKNLQHTYRESSKARISVFGRERYPVRTYTTSSNYRTVKYLPATTYYEVRDAYTEEVIIPFDNNYTKVSCDANGNYFDLWMNTFQSERFYKVAFKVVRNSGSRVEYFDNDNFIFKIVR